MRLWRIASNVPGEYSAADLTGEGARRYGARWNSVGVPAVYASFTVSTAVLEGLAHMGARKPPRNRYLVVIEVPNRLFAHPQHGVKRYTATELPQFWNTEPAHQVTQLWGDERLHNEITIQDMQKLPPIGFAVPSVLVEEDYNVVLNPQHPLVKKQVRASIVRAFVFDHRLVFNKPER